MDWKLAIIGFWKGFKFGFMFCLLSFFMAFIIMGFFEILKQDISYKDKIEVQENFSLCEKYSSLEKIKIKYIDGEKYILFEDYLFKEDLIKEDCKNK